MRKFESSEISLIILSQFFILIVVIFAVFPIYYLIAEVFVTSKENVSNFLGIPIRFSFENVRTAWSKGKFNQAFAISMIIGVSATSIRIFLGSLAGYAFAKMTFIWKRFFYGVFLVSMFIPIIMLIIPLYIIFSKLHLINTYIGTIIIFSGTSGMGFSVYVFTDFFNQLPEALFDAAEADGCSRIRFYFSILLPLSKPIISTLSIINFLWIWNNLLIPLVFLNTESKWPLMVRITAFRGRFYTNVDVLLAGLFIATIPIILLYIFAQKQFVKGMLLGIEK